MAKKKTSSKKKDWIKERINQVRKESGIPEKKIKMKFKKSAKMKAPKV